MTKHLTEMESNAAEYARQMMMPAKTVVRYFEAHGIVSLRDIHDAFPQPGRVAQDMQKAITDWMLT